MKLIRRIGLFQFSSTGLRVCGFVFLVIGAFGAMLQTQMLGAGNMTTMQLLNALEQDAGTMNHATLAIALQAFGSAALPIFTFLLVEGAVHTSNYGKYFLRVFGLAVVCQLPYNLLMTGNLLTMNKLNPVFALVMCMMMLYFFRRYPGKKAGPVLLKVMALFCIFFWSIMLGVDHGPCCVLVAVVVWALRGKQNAQTFLGIMVVFCCAIFSMYYLIAPIGFLILHFYEGKRGSENRLVNYLAYPAILLVSGLLTVLM